MNTYHKFYPNVFVAKCTEKQQKGDKIILTTKHGKEHECIVFNSLYEAGGFYFYSIVRADGFNVHYFAKRRAERLKTWAAGAEKKADKYYEASQEGKDFLVLAEPIKIGHHSEKRHRALIERNHKRFGKYIEETKKIQEYQERSEYWESRAETITINLSMPESLEYFEYELEKAKAFHKGLKDGTIERKLSYSTTYANKAVKDLQAKCRIAKMLWGE